jgi:hypothetical protein
MPWFRQPIPYELFQPDPTEPLRMMPEHPFSPAVVFSDAHPPTVPPLIGLHNLLNSRRYTFDGVAVMGHMRFETL